MQYRLFILNFYLFLGVLVSACELKQEYKPKSVPSTIDEVRQRFQPDRRLSVFKVNFSGEHGDWTLTGEMSSQEAHDALLEELKKALPETRFTDKIVMLPHPDLGAEKNAVVRISVASQYRDAKYGSELINQALMGTEMRLLKKMDGWYYVQLPDGYLGWMSGSYMVRGDDTFLKSWHDRDKVVVRRPYDLVRMAPKLSAAVLSDVVQGIQLAKISVKQGWVEVELPDGRRGFLETASVVSQEDLGKFKPTAKDLESTAQEMLGFPYLWGGTSVKGMDCSGFTVSVYRFNNVTLPRDADMQSNYGQAVELDPQFNQLKKGDLLFFGPSADKITHVGMYLDNARFIHCSGLVKINSLRRGDPNFDADLLERLRKARRILN